MDVVVEPFDLIASIKTRDDNTLPFAPKELSSVQLVDTQLLAQPYAINIVTSFLSDNEAHTLVDSLNALQRDSTSYKQYYNRVYSYLSTLPMRLFAASVVPDITQPPSSLLDIAAHIRFNATIHLASDPALTIHSACSTQARHALVHAELHTMMSPSDHKLLAQAILTPNLILPESTHSAISMFLARNISTTAPRIALFTNNDRSTLAALSQLSGHSPASIYNFADIQNLS
jgi:hypothetical protein